MGAVTRWFCLTKASVSAGTRRIVLAVSSWWSGCWRSPRPASATTETFSFTGAAQTWTVPAGVTEATFDLLRGAGSAGRVVTPPSAAGLGARATATIPVTPGDSIQVNVGGQAPSVRGLQRRGRRRPAPAPVGGGGGASDIRIGGTALTDRVLVAGGGGGPGQTSCNNASTAGGDGGGLSGLDGGSGGVCVYRGRRRRYADRRGQRHIPGDGGRASASAEAVAPLSAAGAAAAGTAVAAAPTARAAAAARATDRPAPGL